MAGLSTLVKAVVELWHSEQSPLLGWAASATLKLLEVALGRVWKPL